MNAFFELFANILAWIYSVVPNYAVAIILLTLLVMVIVTPLTLKGTRSMMIMQQLQPEMRKIQARYKDDRQKLNEELLKFYKENNINPLGGCLPLLVQMPVFLVLYQVLRGLTRRVSDLGSGTGWAVGPLGVASGPGPGTGTGTGVEVGRGEGPVGRRRPGRVISSASSSSSSGLSSGAGGEAGPAAGGGPEVSAPRSGMSWVESGLTLAGGSHDSASRSSAAAQRSGLSRRARMPALSQVSFFRLQRRSAYASIHIVSGARSLRGLTDAAGSPEGRRPADFAARMTGRVQRNAW